MAKANFHNWEHRKCTGHDAKRDADYFSDTGFAASGDEKPELFETSEFAARRARGGTGGIPATVKLSE